MTTGSQQPVVLVNGSFDASERVRNLVSGFDFHSDLSGLIAYDNVILKKYSRILTDRFQFLAQGGKSSSVHRVGMAHGDDIGVRLVDRCMQHKAGAIDGVPPFHHLAFVIREDEVGYLNL